MNTSQSAQLHVRELVSQITHGDPGAAECLFTLFVITDSAQPRGAAIRSEAMTQCFCLTDRCKSAMTAHETEVLRSQAA
jgi:hypothetical protein